MATALSLAVGTELLGVQFRRRKVAGVTVAPSLAHADVRACLLDHMLGRS